MKKLTALIAALMILAAAAAVAEPNETALASLDPFSKSHVKTDNVFLDGKDWYGGTYTTCIGPCESEAEIEYILLEEYNYLQTVLYISGVMLNSDYTYSWDEASIMIYGDDELLYFRKGLNQKQEPEPILLDIRGVRFLRIRFLYDAYFNTGAGRPLALLGDPMLLREPVPGL